MQVTEVMGTWFALSLALLCSISSITAEPPPVAKIPDNFDCGMRSLAYEYAKHLLKHQGDLIEVFDGFELGNLCNKTPPASSPASKAPNARRHAWRLASSDLLSSPEETDSIYADASKGFDTNPGTSSSPVKSLGQAVKLCAALLSSKGGKEATCSVLLRSGTPYYLTETLQLGPRHSGLTITTHPEDLKGGEAAIVSGGIPLEGLEWKPAGTGWPAGVMVSAISTSASNTLGNIDQLYVNDNRFVRARHPNANPGGTYTTGRFSTPTGYFPQAKGWLRSFPKNASKVVSFKKLRNTTRYSDFILGIGGPVHEFEPPAAYWAVENPPAGGGCKYEVPRGVVYEDAAFNATVPPSQWANATGAIVHAFHQAYWGDWKFEVGAHVKGNSSLLFERGTSTLTTLTIGLSLTLSLRVGGFQEARGSCGRGGHDWMIENVPEVSEALNPDCNPNHNPNPKRNPSSWTSPASGGTTNSTPSSTSTQMLPKGIFKQASWWLPNSRL